VNILFFWFVWVGHQTGQISFKTSLETAVLSLVKFIRDQIWLRSKSAGNLGQQIVSTASNDFTPNEFTHRRCLG
jgi:enamine deaminase RidA (YjgF/YER057c/UK114 family)